MKERNSRNLVVLEVIFFLLPTIVFWIFGGTLAVRLTAPILLQESAARLIPLYLFLALSGVAIAATVRVAWAYLWAGGRTAIRQISRAWWGMIGGGLALVAAGSLAAVTRSALLPAGVMPPLIESLGIGVVGIPASILAIHLIIERGTTH